MNKKENIKKVFIVALIMIVAFLVLLKVFLNQGSSNNLRVADEIDEVNKINNGIYWYQDWETQLPVEIKTLFDRAYNVYGINLFSPLENLLEENVEIYFSNSDGKFELIPASQYTVEKKGENITPGGNKTIVYMLLFESNIVTDSFKIIFKGDENHQTISLREIGFWKGMDEEYQEEMLNYENFQETVNSRKGEQKSKEVSFSVLQNRDSFSIFEEDVDESGIPLKLSGFTNQMGYHPSHICKYAIYLSSRYRRHEQQEDLEILENLVNWIEENKVERPSYITWEFYEDLPSFNLEAPWTSALTNAWCAGALLQGYEVTGDKQYEESANKAVEYLLTPVEDGGGLYEFDDGGLWFEEAPNPENPSHILNGFIYAIDILDMFASYYEDERYEDYLNRAIMALRKNVNKYDVGYGSIYDLYTKGNKLGMSYHKIHYVQLYYIYLKTSDEYFLDLSRKWYELNMQSDYVISE